MKNLKQQFSKYDKGLEKTKPQYSALLGKTSTVVEHPTRKGFCYARMADNLNELIVVFNDKVSQVWNLPVLVSRRGNTWYVVGRDTLRYANWGSDSSFIPKHASQHEFNRDNGTGGDAVFVYPDQFVPLLCYPSGTAGSGNVIVAPYMLQRATDFAYVGNTGSPNLLLYKPTNNQGIMGLVYLDKTTGNPGLLIASGTPFAGGVTGSAALTPYLPYPSSNQEPLYFVRLVSGTSSILWDNLYNARQFIGGSSSTGTSGGVTAHNDLTGIQGGSTGSYFHLTDGQVAGLVSGTYTTLHNHTGTVLSTQTPNRVLVTNASGTVGTNNNAKWDTDNDVMSLGGELIAEGTEYPVDLANSLLNLVAKGNELGTQITQFVWATGASISAQWNGRRARGTRASPTAIQSGDILNSFAGFAYDGVAQSATSNARITLRATENQDATHHGAEPVFEYTPIASTTKVLIPLTTMLSGWTPAAGTWAYASASTITIPSDGTTVYQKGMPIRWKQGGGFKYGNIAAVTSTLITILVNTDHTVANSAITDIAYSTVAAPYGFPTKFNFTTALSYAGGTTNPTTITAVSRYSVLSGGLVSVSIIQTLSVIGGGNRTSTRFTMPMAASFSQAIPGMTSITAAGLTHATCYASDDYKIYIDVTMANIGSWWVGGVFQW